MLFLYRGVGLPSFWFLCYWIDSHRTACSHNPQYYPMEGGKRMYRIAMEKIYKWKEGKRRKPLIIEGARQVGKTWLMKEFGSKAESARIFEIFLRRCTAAPYCLCWFFSGYRPS